MITVHRVLDWFVPDGCACSRWRKLATLEFDRNRKSMSVICACPSATPASSGVQTRRTVRASGGNVLLVKGAAESLLERSTQVQWDSSQAGYFKAALCVMRTPAQRTHCDANRQVCNPNDDKQGECTEG